MGGACDVRNAKCNLCTHVSDVETFMAATTVQLVSSRIVTNETGTITSKKILIQLKTSTAMPAHWFLSSLNQLQAMQLTEVPPLQLVYITSTCHMVPIICMHAGYNSGFFQGNVYIELWGYPSGKLQSTATALPLWGTSQVHATCTATALFSWVT